MDRGKEGKKTVWEREREKDVRKLVHTHAVHSENATFISLVYIRLIDNIADKHSALSCDSG